MGDNILLKSAISQPPTLLSEPPKYIAFRHPGYNSLSDKLFHLPRLDSSTPTTSTSIREPTESRVSTDRDSPVEDTSQEPQQEQGANWRQESVVLGVHHGTALLACQIIANNAFDGYLTTDREGQERVTVGAGGILTADSYWFIANRRGDDLNEVEGRDVYPIVPSFQDWVFPDQYFARLLWDTCYTAVAAASIAPEPIAPPPRPRPIVHRCILSNSSYSLEKAHIIPCAHETWFFANDMAHYGRGSRNINDEGNIALLRQDLHSVWDAHNFALVPKGEHFVVHVLNMPDYGIKEFAAAWHNVPIQKDALSHAAGEYLLARFAQAVFMLLKPFIAQSTVYRYVARMQARANDPRQAHELGEQWASASSLRDSYSGGGSKSASPSTSRKRSRSECSVDPGNRGDKLGGSWYERNVRPTLYPSDSESEVGWYAANVAMKTSDSEDGAASPQRGRSRKRRRRQPRKQSKHTVDTPPSLTDSSATSVNDVDHSFEERVASPLPSCNAGGQDKHTREGPAEVVYD